MLEILLVFMVNGGEPEVSDRVFGSFDECKEFVETLAGDSVVNSDYGFEFLANDGVHFLVSASNSLITLSKRVCNGDSSHSRPRGGF